MLLEDIYGIFRFLNLFIVFRTFSCGLQSLALFRKDYNFGFRGYKNTFLCFLVVWLFCWLCSTRTDAIKFVVPFYAFQITLVIVTAYMELINILIEQKRLITELPERN